MKVEKTITKGIFGAVNKEAKNLWCNTFLNKTPIKLSSKAELNAGLQAFNINKFEGLGTMGLLGNVKAGKIKSITVKKENDIAVSRKAVIVSVEKMGKLNATLSCGKISS